MVFANKYSYTRSVDSVNVEQLSDETYLALNKVTKQESGTDVLDGVISFDNISQSNNLVFSFFTPLSGAEVILLNQVVSAHIPQANYIPLVISPVSYNNVIITTLSATTINASSFSANTIYSGNTNLYSIFQSVSNSASIQNGINTFTGGTPSKPTVNVTALTINSISVSGASTFNSLSSTTLSASTIYSGNTNISTIISNQIAQSSGNTIGTTFQFDFFNNGCTSDKWLRTIEGSYPSDSIPIIIPYDSALVGLSFSNKKNASTDIEVYKNGTLVGSKILTWSISAKTHSYKTNITSASFSAGDRISVFARKNGSIAPEHTMIMCFFRTTSNNTGEGGGIYSS